MLVDTSVWVDHLHSPNAFLISLLEKDEALTHPFIIGELALGHLKNRSQFLHDLQLLPLLYPALNPEVLDWFRSTASTVKALIGWTLIYCFPVTRINVNFGLGIRPYGPSAAHSALKPARRVKKKLGLPSNYFVLCPHIPLSGSIAPPSIANRGWLDFFFLPWEHDHDKWSQRRFYENHRRR